MMRVAERLVDEPVAEHAAGSPADLPRPVAPLSYAPAAAGRARLASAVTLTMIICGTLLVVAPIVAVVWACTAEYYNDTVNALAPYAWTSALVGILLLAFSAFRGATQRDARS
jgi:hypothetical protein